MSTLRCLACAILLAAVHAPAAPLAANDWVSPDAPRFVDRCLSSLPLEPVQADISSPPALSVMFLPLLLAAAAIAAAYRSPLYARCYRYLFGPLDNY